MKLLFLNYVEYYDTAYKPIFFSFKKVAGMCGYLAGKISYLPICSEKFKKLKDSPIGDVLRQAQRHSSHK